jgi:fructokinase
MIVVAGESLVDMVPNGSGGFAAHCGGGPFNTARALARLAQRVGFLGCISDDDLGRRLRQALEADGVSLDLVVETSLPTTLAFASLSDEASASYRFYTEGTSVPGLTAASALAVLPTAAEALHVGSLGLVLEPIADAVMAVTVAAAARGALVMFDPNIRPTLIDDRAAYLERLERVVASADVVKASVEDLAWIGAGEPAETVARRLLAAGPVRVVLMTRGAEGAVAFSGGASVAVPAPPVRVVDTIGAGDAFSAGFLAWWLDRGLGREQLSDRSAVGDAARFGCVVASRTCERAGADPPWLAEIGRRGRPMNRPRPRSRRSRR